MKKIRVFLFSMRSDLKKMKIFLDKGVIFCYV